MVFTFFVFFSIKEQKSFPNCSPKASWTNSQTSQLINTFQRVKKWGIGCKVYNCQIFVSAWMRIIVLNLLFHINHLLRVHKVTYLLDEQGIGVLWCSFILGVFFSINKFVDIDFQLKLVLNCTIAIPRYLTTLVPFWYLCVTTAMLLYLYCSTAALILLYFCALATVLLHCRTPAAVLPLLYYYIPAAVLLHCHCCTTVPLLQYCWPTTALHLLYHYYTVPLQYHSTISVSLFCALIISHCPVYYWYPVLLTLRSLNGKEKSSI